MTVTGLILLYNSDFQEAIMTVQSFLIQKGINLELVISDDGSENDTLDKIREYLDSIGKNAVYIKNKSNLGTVRNIYNATRFCKGKYVKALSPGDVLFGDNILQMWVDFMETNNLSASFADAIYYRIEDDDFVVLKEKAYPQDVSIVGGTAKSYRNMILYDDIWMGAATFIRLDILQKYISKIVGKVRYAEDQIFKLMICKGEKCLYFGRPVIWYEYGVGISTSNQSKWNGLLIDDLLSTYELLDDAEYSHFGCKMAYHVKTVAVRKFYESKQKAMDIFIKDIMVNIAIPGGFFWRRYHKRNIRYTNSASAEYLKMIKGQLPYENAQK